MRIRAIAFLCLLVLAASLAAQVETIAETEQQNTSLTKINNNFLWLAGRAVNYGTALPGTCTVGQFFLDTDAPIQDRLWYCSAADTWVRAATCPTIQNGGSTVGSDCQIDFAFGTGLVAVIGSSGGEISVAVDIDTAVMLTKEADRGAAHLAFSPTSGSGSTYTGCMTPPLGAYAEGTLILFKPDVANTGAANANICALGNRAIKLPDGTDPAASALASNQGYLLWDNGTHFRVIAGLPGGGGTGTVTSVGLTMPAEFSVTGSPVTTSGTLTVAKANQSANTIFAGPNSGGAAVPTFRAMVAADLPTTAVTPGTYTNATVTLDETGRVTAASSGTGGSYDPMATDFTYLRESWLGSNATVLGSPPWRTTNSGGGSVLAIASESGRPGIIRISTGASSGNFYHVYGSPSGSTDDSYVLLADLTAKTGWRYVFRIRSIESTDVAITCGLVRSGFWQSEGAYLQYSTAAGDTNWMAVTHNGTSGTRSSTGVAYAASTWFTLEVRSDVTGQYSFAVNGTVTNSGVTSTLPNDPIVPGCLVGTSTTAAKTLDWDEYWAKVNLQ